MKIAIIDYGAGNVQSVQFSLARLGYESCISKDAEVIKTADRVIFPGVGEAQSAMQKLNESGLSALIPNLEQPVLGICLGMQLMCNYSEEGSTKGLGIFDTEVVRFSTDVKAPKVGWNTIYDLKSDLFANILEQTYQYFVHSYYVPTNPKSIAKAYYGEEYTVALQNDNFFGVQFHPEKSGIVGEQLLFNFLNLKV